MWPKARGLGRTGVLPSLEMERSVPPALAETAQLLASGNSSCWYIVNVFNRPPSPKYRKASRVTYSSRDPCLLSGMPLVSRFLKWCLILINFLILWKTAVFCKYLREPQSLLSVVLLSFAIWGICFQIPSVFHFKEYRLDRYYSNKTCSDSYTQTQTPSSGQSDHMQQSLYKESYKTRTLLHREVFVSSVLLLQQRTPSFSSPAVNQVICPVYAGGTPGGGAGGGDVSVSSRLSGC